MISVRATYWTPTDWLMQLSYSSTSIENTTSLRLNLIGSQLILRNSSMLAIRAC